MTSDGVTIWFSCQLSKRTCLKIPLTPSSQQSLLLAASETGPERRKVIEQTIAVDPLLLFWSVCEYAKQHGEAASTRSTVIDWLDSDFFAILTDVSIGKVTPDGDASKDSELSAQASEFYGQDLSLWKQTTVKMLLTRQVTVDSHHAKEDASCLGLVRPWARMVIAQFDNEDGVLKDELGELLGPLGDSSLPDDSDARVLEFARTASATLWDELGLSPGTWGKLLGKLRQASELEHSFEELLQAEKLNSMRELAYGCSHEVNNPLANISSRAQTLLRTESDPEKRRQLATINSQAFRAFEMIANLMLFAKPPQLNYARTDIGNLVSDVVAGFREDAVEQGTELKFSPPEQTLQADVDADQLSVGVYSLIRNAMESLQSGGHVSVEVSTDDGRLIIAVSDDGPGIPEDVRNHLFDPFYSGREAGRGLGFGLSKCWTIAQLHDGDVLVSDPDATEIVSVTTFTLVLPMQKAENVDQESSDEARQVRTA